MTVSLRDRIAEKLPKLEIIATAGMVEELRLVKDQDEIALLRKAVWQAEKAFGVLRATLRPEQTEKELVDELARQLRLFGAKDSPSPRLRRWGRGRPCPMRSRGPIASARGSFCWSIGGPMRACTRAT